MEFLELAEKRYSCRKVKEQKVPRELVEKILKAGDLAPTAVNKQPYQVWVLESEEAYKAVAESTHFLFGAKTFILIGAKKESAWVRPADGYNFAAVDASIVATHMMLEIQALGLGTTWVGHFDPAKLAEHYPEMADYECVALFPVGYPTADAKPSDRHTKRKGIAETKWL